MHRFLSVLLALVASPAVGQPEDPWVFDRIYSGDGLSHNSVYAIHQDRDGFMWFGTLDGLNRYDGYEFVVHRHDPADSTSLSHNVVTVFHEDPDGTLWVGTGGGLNRLGADTTAFRRYALFPDRPGEPWVGDIERDPRGTLWVSAGDNLYWYDEPRDQMVTDATLSGGMRALRPGPDDDLWVLRLDEGTAERSLCRIDASARGVRDCSRLIGAWGAVSEFLMDPDGSVWFDHTGRAIKTNGTLAPSGPVADYRAPAIRRLNDGTRVIGSAGDGIYRCRDASPCVQSLIDPRRPTWLHNYVRSLYQDRAGGLWVGTYGGVYRRDPNRKPFRVHRHDPAESADARDDASVNAISALARTSNGTLWVGTFGNGLSRLDEATGMLTTEPSWSPRLGTVIWDLMVRKDGSLWAGTDRGLV
ncbi:MAG: two-component regulator propeller domain-containing protein, partial [Bacteroidota bacterium]